MMAHPNEASIWMFEVHDSGPVVGFVLDKSTSGTGRETGKVIVGVHRKIETAYQKAARMSSTLKDLVVGLTHSKRRGSAMGHSEVYWKRCNVPRQQSGEDGGKRSQALPDCDKAALDGRTRLFRVRNGLTGQSVQ